MLIWEIEFTEKDNLFGTAWSKYSVEADTIQEAIIRAEKEAMKDFPKRLKLQITKAQLVLEVDLPKKKME